MELSLNSVNNKIDTTKTDLQTQINGKQNTIVEDATHRWFTDTEKTKLSGISASAEVNQLAFSNVKVGATIVAADSKTDTIELIAGTNVTITANTTTQAVTINASATPYTHPASHSGSMITEDSTHRWTTDTEKSNWNAKANGTHQHAGTDITSAVTNATNATNAVNATNATNATNADTVDTLHASSFMRSDTNATTTGSVTVYDTNDGQVLIGGSTSGSIEIGKAARSIAGTPFIDFHSSANSPDYDVRLTVSGGSTTVGQGTLNISASQITLNSTKIWHQGNDGTGSGLDADTVDGLHANQIASTDDMLIMSMFFN